jgi:5-methylcytosine-specific restriction protein B
VSNLKPRVWKISQGGNGNTSIQNSSYNDNKVYFSFDQIQEKSYQFDGNFNNRRGENQIAIFKDIVNIGDYVIVPKSNLHGAFLGRISSDYTYQENSGEYPRTRKLETISRLGNFKLNNIKNKLKWEQATIEKLDYDNVQELYEDFDINDDETLEKDYQNFFNMLKFWIQQTNQNIANAGQRVTFKEIREVNLERASKEFIDPKFEPEYIHYSNFDIQISFVRQGNYKGEKVNFVVWKRDNNNQSWWLNIRYSYDRQKIICNYRSDLENNTDSTHFKEYMESYGLNKEAVFEISDLNLEGIKANNSVKNLFNTFYEMIKKTRKYGIELKGSMKAQELTDKLKQSYNIILRGAPGTGKTYLSKEIAANMIGCTTSELSESTQFEFVQFHPSYDYTDFVEGLRPIQKDGQIGFEAKDGIFKRFCKLAAQHAKDKNFVFVIDEINRGEISKIFGELFFSIDPEYRGKAGAVTTQYSNLFINDDKFYIPENVYIIATMNDIDRSVDTFDFAMRRRFTFEEITANDSQIMLKDNESKLLMNRINEQLVLPEFGLSTDYQIGASYFRILEGEYAYSSRELWNNKLRPLFNDYFRGERNVSQKIEKLEKVYFGDDTDDFNQR